MKEHMCKKGTSWITINAEEPKPTTFEDLGYVQVVRCKDCINHNNNGCRFVRYGVRTKDEWFCADGERKEGW